MGVKTQQMGIGPVLSTPVLASPVASTTRVKQWFLCILALCHLAAFSSLYVQWPGNAHSFIFIGGIMFLIFCLFCISLLKVK